MNIKEFIELEKKIKKRTGLKCSALAVALGYNKGYISQIKSRGVIPEKFVIAMQRQFLPNANDGNRGNDEVRYIETDEAHVFSKFEQRLIRLESYTEVFENAIAGLLSKSNKDFMRRVSELREEVSKAVNRRFSESGI